MEYDNVTEWIQAENGHLRTADSQVTVAEWFVENEVSEGFNTKKSTSDAEEELENSIPNTVEVCLENLEEIGVLKEYPPRGSGYLIIHERTDQPYFPPFEGTEYQVKQLYATEVARFILDLRSRDIPEEKPEAPVTDGGKSTFRQLAANGLGVDEAQVEETLLGTSVPVGLVEEELKELALGRDDPLGEGVPAYSNAFSEVAESSNYEPRRDYDNMTWLSFAKKYALSEKAHHLEFTHTLDELS